MEKKRLLISIGNLPTEVLQAIKAKYPYGYNHDVKEVMGIDNNKLYVLPIETNEATYLVKIDLQKPIKISELEDLYAEDEDDFAGSSDDLPTEEIVVEEDDE